MTATVWPSARMERRRGRGDSAVRTWPATWAAVNPTAMALFGSTVTWISGVALTRSLLRLMRPGCRLEAGQDGVGGLGDVGRVLAADDEAQPVRA